MYTNTDTSTGTSIVASTVRLHGHANIVMLVLSQF